MKRDEKKQDEMALERKLKNMEKELIVKDESELKPLESHYRVALSIRHVSAGQGYRVVRDIDFTGFRYLQDAIALYETLRDEATRLRNK